MSKPLFHKPLPRHGDPRKFAQQGIVLEGSLAIVDLPRLVDAVEDSRGDIQVALNFGLNEEGKRVVTGVAHGQVALICQRCLEPVMADVHSDISLAIVWDEDMAKALPSYLDPWIVGEGAADFYEMIEEELLLGLPPVAYHSEPCVDKGLYSSGKPVEVKETKNPFKVLEQLKSSPK